MTIRPAAIATIAASRRPRWDGTIAAQKALSAVYRTGQRFGSHTLVDLLLGADDERIERFGHDRLKTFGVGAELDRRGWLSVFRQLAAQGLVVPDLGGHGGLSLGSAAAEILRGAATVRFRLDPERKKRDRRKAGETGSAPARPASMRPHKLYGKRCAPGASPRRGVRSCRLT